MTPPPHTDWAIWAIAGLAVIGLILRPGRLPGWLYVTAGVGALLGLGLLPPTRAWAGIRAGTDVYLFLIGMMGLAETARVHGLFDWLAGWAAGHARGSPTRLFALVYAVGVVVTVFLSNDATAVVLTPAVAAVARAAGAPALPYLLACAFVANAASFVLPISNPANLVITGGAPPPLMDWLRLYGLASLAAVAATYAALRWQQRAALRQPPRQAPPAPSLSPGGRMAGWGLLGTAPALTAASALGWPLGITTLAAGLGVGALVSVAARRPPWPVLRGLSWGVLPLVAALFALVAALSPTPLMTTPAHWLAGSVAPPGLVAMLAGIGAGLISNLANNLPVGLAVAGLVHTATPAPVVTAGLLIGVDLGPNLSVTGSLATLLWLEALKREGLDISAGRFLAAGLVVTPPALLLALAALVL